MSEPQRLERAMGPWMAAAIVVGTTIGSGVFKKPAAIAQVTPDFQTAMAAWILIAVLTLFGGLAMAEISVLLPKAGGNYVYLREAYGRMFGFLWGWVEFFIIRSASIAALAGIFAESLHDVIRQSRSDPSVPVFDFWTLQAITVVTIAVLALVNARGVRWGGGLQTILTAVKIGAIVLMAIAPFAIHAIVAGAPGPDYDYLRPNPKETWTLAGFGAALIGVLWPFHGWMNLGPVAEEIKSPQRNIPLALLGGIGVIALLYLSLNVAYAVVISQDDLRALKGTTVAAEFSRRLLGPIGAAFAAGAVMCSVFGSLNGNLLVGPRLLYAMAEDKMAPQPLSSIHREYKTPAVATLVYAGWSIALVVLVAGAIQFGLLEQGKSHFDIMTDFAMFGAVVFETMTVASIFVFRRTRPNAERAYRCWGYPVVPAIYVIALVGVLASYFANDGQRREAFTGIGFVLAGAVFYWMFLRRRPQSE